MPESSRKPVEFRYASQLPMALRANMLMPEALQLSTKPILCVPRMRCQHPGFEPEQLKRAVVTLVHG